MAEQTQLSIIKNYFNGGAVKKKFEEMLGAKAQGFITSVLQVVSSNDMLAKADPVSVYQAAATAATLDLPINNNLGFAYIVPYKTKIKDENGNDMFVIVAQFQMGYKGFKQLALRTSQFKTISSSDVREGEIESHDRLSGEIVFNWIQDEQLRNSKKIVGFVSYFKLLNGFEQTLYMTVEKLKEHGVKYSQTFKKGYGLWKDSFEDMATKTVTKLNLSKNAPLSIDMQRAIISDQAVIKDAETNEVEYVDHEVVPEVDFDELQALYDYKKETLTSDEQINAERILKNKESASYKKLQTLLQSK